MKEEFPQTAAPAPGNRPSRPPAGEAPARPLPLEPWEGSAILLVDLDAFFASVEQLDHPAWRGKPVIVGGDADKHGVVSTASYEARPYGVRSAMPSSTARRLCPDAIWTHGRFDRYREVSNAIMAILRSETPHVQQVSIDEAFLDVTPTVVNREHPVRVAQRIQRRVEELGVTCSIGAGTSKTIAKIASDMDKPRGLTVVYPGSERDFLAPLPVRVMSGIGASAEEKLKSRGIRTLGQLADADLRMLERVFGKLGRVMHVRANGGDDAPVEQDDAVKSVSNEMTFATDLTRREDVEAAIATMAAKVGRRLRRKGLRGRTLALRVKFDDLSVRSVQRQLPRPSDDELAYTPLLYAMVDEVWRPGTPLRLIGVGMSGFSEEGVVQESLFDVAEAAPSADDVEPVVRDERKRRGLIEATDLVKDRFGEAAVRFGHELRNEENTTGSSSKNPADYK
ncbi:MAG: DNA polymerase IV [Gordonibacter pamelaeae]|uniref:DNA polymerase IV n=3 Tax=Gordonibacter TaxID=644652 RepID=A0A369LXW9_9ACTN|nr:DNA polymerase IV [Gordonibacter pamelaeae]MSA61397.1 DNA polymerase IV [Gordonibacter pamelaeae]MSA95536.1 DNA polymerase IV [Gordonibacter urolithinfaciens]RDB63469.1 DNA polymerase IV [Gordonibacter pamelaeae]